MSTSKHVPSATPKQQQPSEENEETSPSKRWAIMDQFQGPNKRSCPGQPPKERFGRPFLMPFSELSVDQAEAARLLFQDDDDDKVEDRWESIMPRRSYSHIPLYVLYFQKKTWNQLSKEQRNAAKLLDISGNFWNDTLALFHDDLWTVSGVTLNPKEFASVLGTIRKMSRSSVLTKRVLAHFLLGLEKLLLPSQGKAIVETLKASSSWESLLQSSGGGKTEFHAHLVVASFLSDPGRFVSIPYQQLLAFWHDDSAGCLWSNASGKLEQKNTNGSYAQALTTLISRRLVEPILTKATACGRTTLLPKPIANSILNEFLGFPDNGPTMDPFGVVWLHGTYGVSLQVFFAPTSQEANKKNRSNVMEIDGSDDDIDSVIDWSSKSDDVIEIDMH